MYARRLQALGPGGLKKAVRADVVQQNLTRYTAPGGRNRIGPDLQARGARVRRADVYVREAIALSPASIARLRAFAESAATQWGRFDLILTPALAFEPPLIGAFRERGPEGDYRLQCEWAPHTSMVNVAGLPAIAVPLGSLPHESWLGVQLIGRPGSESQLLQLATQLMQD